MCDYTRIGKEFTAGWEDAAQDSRELYVPFQLLLLLLLRLVDVKDRLYARWVIAGCIHRFGLTG